MIITINGKAGSGKSTLASMLADALGYKRYYIGGMRREAARKKGMTLEEYNLWSETHPEGDKEFDAFLTNLGKKENNFVIESRTAFHFIPTSLKIYLDVSDENAAKRIFNDAKLRDRNERKHITTEAEVLAGIHERQKSDAKRYNEYYGIDIHKPEHYDLVIDTNGQTVDEVFQIVMDLAQTYKGNKLTRPVEKNRGNANRE